MNKDLSYLGAHEDVESLTKLSSGVLELDHIL